jgi:hypothetical protein
MNKTKLRKFCGLFCIFGAITGFLLAILNTVFPSSQGMTITNDFVVLIPWLHRLEHAVFALIVYPALSAGFLGFYLIGAIGRGIVGKILALIATTGGVLAVLSSLTELFVLQSETADKMREIGFALILILICPVLFTIAALSFRKVRLWKRFAPILTFILLVASLLLSYILNLGGRYVELFTGIGLLSWCILGYAVYSESELTGEEVKLDSLPDADQQAEQSAE